MGYYVNIVSSNAGIRPEVQPTVLAIWKAMNAPEFDSFKNGGSWGGGKQTAKWYSWMDEKYDQICHTVESVLDMLGFEYDVMADGEIIITNYDSKTGQEDLFFEAVKPYITGHITWEGEEGEQWTWNFDDKNDEMATGSVVTVLATLRDRVVNGQKLLTAS